MDSAAFRRVLSAGINRPHITNAFLSGHGLAAQFPVCPVSPLYPSGLETVYTSDGFASALAELNYTPERSLSLLVNEENSFKLSIAHYLAETYTAAGIPVEVRALPWADYTAALAAGDFDLYYGEIKLSADWNLSPLLSSDAALNYGGWKNAQTDYLLASALSSADRTTAVQTLCAHLQQYAPMIPLCFKSTSVLTQTDVISGLAPTMMVNEDVYPAMTPEKALAVIEELRGKG
jgi:peptide/nickel transport system substrate-binding protein